MAQPASGGPGVESKPHGCPACGFTSSQSRPSARVQGCRGEPRACRGAGGTQGPTLEQPQGILSP